MYDTTKNKYNYHLTEITSFNFLLIRRLFVEKNIYRRSVTNLELDKLLI